MYFLTYLLAYLLAYLLFQWCSILFEKLTGLHPQIRSSKLVEILQLIRKGKDSKALQCYVTYLVYLNNAEQYNY
jgi:hypothetical protein